MLGQRNGIGFPKGQAQGHAARGAGEGAPALSSQLSVNQSANRNKMNGKQWRLGRRTLAKWRYCTARKGGELHMSYA